MVCSMMKLVKLNPRINMPSIRMKSMRHKVIQRSENIKMKRRKRNITRKGIKANTILKISTSKIE